ncbi:MAG: Flp family type IVb pilin [Spirochaetes bacterium]|nr:Flp family type IVb pilin [Spirochaetota bacterium]
MLKKFLNDETGQGMTEYILIVVLVAVAAIVVVKVFGEQIKSLFQKSTDKIKTETEDAFN